MCVCHIRADESAVADAKDLRTLRSVFRKSLIEAIMPEQRSHLDQLLKLEKKLAAAHDFSNAIRARDERLTLEQELTVLEQELPMLTARAAGEGKVLPERIPLKLEEAVLTGVRLDSDGALTGWMDAQCLAAWKLPGVPAGGYEIILKYSCGRDGGGQFLLKENFYTLRGTLTPTDGKPMERNVGTLRIRDGHGALTLAVNAPSKDGLLRVWSMELAPVSR